MDFCLQKGVFAECYLDLLDAYVRQTTLKEHKLKLEWCHSRCTTSLNSYFLCKGHFFFQSVSLGLYRNHTFFAFLLAISAFIAYNSIKV